MRIKTSLLNFLFPKFSELELVTLLFILLLFIIEHSYQGVTFIIISYKQAWNEFDIKGLLSYTIVLLYILFIFAKAAEHALSTKKMITKDKETLVMVFYLLLSGVTLISLWGTQITRADSFINTVENFIAVFIMARSFLSMFAVAHFSKKDKEVVYTDQLSDEQVSKKELISTIIVSILLYSFLRRDNGVALSVVLTYFYATSVVIFFRQNSERVMRFFQYVRKR